MGLTGAGRDIDPGCFPDALPSQTCMECLGGACTSCLHTTLPISYLLSCAGHSSCSQLSWELGWAGLVTCSYPYDSGEETKGQRDDVTKKADLRAWAPSEYI